ncbi:MAG: hypothetical protein SAK42_21185, partial [Oscillatoria sp. PMC 1076.18]|nr:hypothetical protein [Oscillatoria sp. PMC 1076.18]
KNDLPLKVFISPSHATQWKAIELSGLWDEFEQWKQEIVKITSVWDFSGYNSVTTEPISDKMKNYLDNSHYSKAVGNLVLNRIFQVQEELIPADFGVLINSQNVKLHLKNIRENQIIWEGKYPEQEKLVREVYLQVTKSKQ